MSASVNFASTPRLGMGRVSVAAANPLTPGAVVPVFAAGASGSRIHRIDINALGNTTAGIIFLFVWSGSGHYYLIASVDVDVVGMVGGTPPFSASLYYPEGYPLPVGHTLYASTFVGETFDVTAHGGDF